jgi:hypothetical protein
MLQPLLDIEEWVEEQDSTKLHKIATKLSGATFQSELPSTPTRFTPPMLSVGQH